MNERVEAEPVQTMICKKTGAVVGWMYEWNTGEMTPRWTDKPVSNVSFRAMRSENAAN